MNWSWILYDVVFFPRGKREWLVTTLEADSFSDIRKRWAKELDRLGFEITGTADVPGAIVAAKVKGGRLAAMPAVTESRRRKCRCR